MIVDCFTITVTLKNPHSVTGKDGAIHHVVGSLRTGYTVKLVAMAIFLYFTHMKLLLVYFLLYSSTAPFPHFVFMTSKSQILGSISYLVMGEHVLQSKSQ